jgi:hypothetical protein
MREGKKAEQWIKEHFFELSPDEQAALSHLKPRRRKLPNQKPVPLSPGSRRKTRASS